MTQPVPVLFYTRRNCHLCEAARRELGGAGFAFREIDVAGDPALEAEFGTMVPVVEFNGQVVFSASMDPSQIPELLLELGSA